MKKLLIVVDYQNDFVCGSLGSENAKAIENAVADKILEYRNNRDEIVFTLDTHYDDYLSTLEGKSLPVPHCIENTDGHRLYGKTGELVKEDDKIFLKSTYASEELFEYLKNREYISVELCGVITNICVISNAVIVKTALPRAPVYVDANAVASGDNALNRQALNVMKSMHIRVLNDKRGKELYG